MIDIHCHIMPGVDDGASDFAETVSMADTARICGVTDIIVTPHCNVPNSYANYYGDEYRGAFSALEAILKEHGVKMTLHQGMEVFATNDIAALYERGDVITLAGSRYMLVEFDFDDDAWRVKDVLESLSAKGVVPIIAHPERYFMVQDDPQFAIDWVGMGCLLQLNRTSIIGRMNESSTVVAHELLSVRAAHFVATDSHGVFSRTTELFDAYDLIAENYSERWAHILMEENPRRVIENKRVKRLPPEDDGYDQ